MALAQAITDPEAFMGLILPLIVAFGGAAVVVGILMYAWPKQTKNWKKQLWIPLAIVVILGIVIYVMTAQFFTASIIST